MNNEKVNEYIALFGGVLGSLLLLLRAVGWDPYYFNEETINLLLNFLTLTIPFLLVTYGIYKNTYILTDKAKAQEKVLKEKGLK